MLPAEHAPATVQALIRRGVAETHTGHRVRLVAFGSVADRTHRGRYACLSLGHVIEFIERYLRDHWDVLRHAQFKHPALGMFMVREKARREAGEYSLRGSV